MKKITINCKTTNIKYTVITGRNEVNDIIYYIKITKVMLRGDIPCIHVTSQKIINHCHTRLKESYMEN